MAGEKILFIDDEELTRKLVSTYLARSGYQVTTATDGAEALRLLSRELPDLLVTDVGLPSVSGLELTKRLRSMPETARLPIIMLSAHTDTDDVLAGYGQGADEYVTKPVELPVLGAKVEVLLRRARSTPAPQQPQRRGILVAFVHAKGGVGTTTLAVNTAVCLARPEQPSRVALVDLNLEFSSADLLLDVQARHRLEELALYDLDEVEQGTIAELLTPHASGLAVLAGTSAPEAGERLTVAMVNTTLDHLRALAEYVVVDLPASFSEINLAVLDAADAVCVVTSADLAALKVTRDCVQIIKRLNVIPRDRLLVVLNRLAADGLPDESVARFLQYRPDCTVPFDGRFRQAADEGRPLVRERRTQPSGRAIQELAQTLEGVGLKQPREYLAWSA